MLTLQIALQFALLPAAAPPQDVDFLRDVQPILTRCYECHGPEVQKGKMRLDVDRGIFEEDGVIVRGNPQDSLLFELISLPADDPEVMPNEGDLLTREQIETIRRWIEQGAPYVDTVVAEEVDPLALPPLSAEQAAARDAALVALAERGIHPLPVAQEHEALDLNASLLREKAGDAEAQLLSGLEPVLVWANFSGTVLTDAGLAALGHCGELRRLNVSRTKVTDAGLAELAGLTELTYLNLYGTAVTDAGLAQLHGLKGLEKLFLWDTPVTDEGVERLLAALPGLRVNRGAELVTIEPPPGPVNTKCAFTGKDANPEFTSEFEGLVVAFCCGDCKAKFDADPAAFADEIPELKAKLAAKPINDKCPISGKPIDPAHFSTFEGKTVAFCCPNCKPAFDADPEKFREKLGLGD